MSFTRPRPRLLRRPAPTPETAPPPAHPAYSTQVIPFRVIERLFRYLVWAACAVSFGVSWLGNIGVFGGDLGAWLAAPLGYTRSAWTVFACALAFQLAVQIGQFYAARARGRRSVLYLFLLALSVAPSVATYSPVVLAGLDWTSSIVGIVVLAVALALNDALQEVILVKE